ncbi:DNA methyltransferase [Mesorhizobium sp. M0208]|uniref:DNA methyltransferase n=1 Tax=Mesorhizobium sp. M0208 TaxID=2956916 RepID=UPI003338A553
MSKLWAMTLTTEDGPGQTIAKACFSAILLPSCREDRHWGYVCDNSQPKSFREPDAKALFLTSLHRLAAAYVDRDEQTGSSAFPAARIIKEDAAQALRRFDHDTVDCVVTSPPYFGVADYVKAQRLSMEWFGEDIESVRKTEIGARSKRHRNRALDEYIAELTAVFVEVHRVMRPGGIATVVFGQSPSRADAQETFKDALLWIGFSVEKEMIRQIPVGRRQMPSVVRETVFILGKN